MKWTTKYPQSQIFGPLPSEREVGFRGNTAHFGNQSGPLLGSLEQTLSLYTYFRNAMPGGRDGLSTLFEYTFGQEIQELFIGHIQQLSAYELTMFTQTGKG